jgi:hypothetical protein
MIKKLAILSGIVLFSASSYAEDAVPDSVIEAQRAALAANTEGQGFGPQSPRDIDSVKGKNKRLFGEAPKFRKMNLCNIHFHKFAEHKGGQFTTYAGNGDGLGKNTGYKYSGKFTKSELEPTAPVCDGKYGALNPGDTIEVHYVHTSADVEPGPTLGACLSPSIANPQLRVEAVVMALVNDPKAADFVRLAEVGERRGYAQAMNISKNLGYPVQYAGSTTGPKFNEEGSPLQVSWSVRPKVLKVDVASVGEWCEDNIFDEVAAHGVRNLVTNKDLLSKIKKKD